jgi:CNP1-like family
MRLKYVNITIGLSGFFLLAMATIAHAQSSLEEDFDSSSKSWQEIALQLPAAPLAENLLPFYVSAIATQSFAIDAKSLTVGTDGVIRYTLMARSESGVQNISYEGVRCESWEKKLYAFWHQTGNWSRSRRDRWEQVERNIANRPQAALIKDYMCEGKTIAGNAEQILERIRMKKALAPS